MSVTIDHDSVPRPPSPWTGSQHQTRHRWQLDAVSSLAEAARDLRKLAAELAAAHRAGWWLVAPMRSGHLLAARASRRQRSRQASNPPPPVTGSASPPAHRWRLRLVDEPARAGDEVLDTAAATRTPAVAWVGRSLRQVSGPDITPDVLAEVARQVTATDLGSRRWGLAPARVGPSFDLVADGSALRLHAVHDGALLRTHEVLTFQHAADGAGTLLEAAAAYERLARAADAMAAAGGRLVSADDGFLHVEYDRSPA